MFRVVVLKGEDYDFEFLPGDFKFPEEIISAYPMLSWLGEDLMLEYMKTVLYDQTVYAENLTSIYEKEFQGSGTSSYFTDGCVGLNNDVEVVFDPTPNEEQLAELRKYMVVFITFDKITD